MSEPQELALDFKATPFVPRYADQVKEWVEGYGYGSSGRRLELGRPSTGPFARASR